MVSMCTRMTCSDAFEHQNKRKQWVCEWVFAQWQEPNLMEQFCPYFCCTRKSNKLDKLWIFQKNCTLSFMTSLLPPQFSETKVKSACGASTAYWERVRCFALLYIQDLPFICYTLEQLKDLMQHLAYQCLVNCYRLRKICLKPTCASSDVRRLTHMEISCYSA